jgi:hypothetical protein
MVFQIAEGGGVAFLAGEKVLVDARYRGAERSVVQAGSTLQAPQKVALHGGGADALAPSQTAPVDAVEVLLINHLLETFGGSLAGLNAWQGLAKPAATVQTAALADFQVEDPTRRKPQSSWRTRRWHQPLFGRRDPPHWGHAIGPVRNRAAVSLEVANLVLG